MPSWRSPPRTGTGSDCEGATAGGASTSSPSSTIPTSPPTTMAASASSVLPPPTARSPAASAPTGAPTSTPPSAPSSAPPHGAVSTPFRPSAQPYRPVHPRTGLSSYQQVTEIGPDQLVQASGWGFNPVLSTSRCTGSVLDRGRCTSNVSARRLRVE